MASRTIYIDADSILKLLTHYSDGDVPLDAELQGAGVSRWLGRWIGLVVKSDQWAHDSGAIANDGGLKPLHVRYEGKKVLSWKGGDEPLWVDAPEGPKRTD